MACRLVALDKCPGTRPVGIGEAYQWLWAKLVLQKAGDQAKTACGNLQLCAGLEAEIKGAVHAVRRQREERRIERESRKGMGTVGWRRMREGETQARR
eukprot:15332335-Ditylum_brightwellii.AAC.1